MDIVVLLVFVSLVLVAAALAFFVTRLRGGDFDHGERLSLLPLSDDDGAGPGATSAAKTVGPPTDGLPTVGPRTDDRPDTEEEDDADASR